MAPAAAPDAARPSRIARLLSGVTAAGGVAGRRRMPRRAGRRSQSAALLGVGILRRLLAEPEVFRLHGPLDRVWEAGLLGEIA